MAALYLKYLADGPLFLLYSIHDGITERCGIREGFEIVGNRDRISSEGDGD